MAKLRLFTIAVVCTMLLIPIAGFSSNIVSGPLLIAVSFGLAYVVIPALLLHLWPPPASGKAAKSMQEALWDGEIVTTEHAVLKAAQIEETEDEGLHFLVAVENGQTLSLSGQYLNGLVERNQFPSKRLRVFANKKSGAFYGIEPVGGQIAPWPVYGPLSLETDDSGLMMIEDGAFHPQSIEEIVSQLGLQPVRLE